MKLIKQQSCHVDNNKQKECNNLYSIEEMWGIEDDV